jgi:hypothetical protein
LPYITISNLKTRRFETRRFETWRFVNLTFWNRTFVNLTFCKPYVLKPDVLKPDVLKPEVLWVYLLPSIARKLRSLRDELRRRQEGAGQAGQARHFRRWPVISFVKVHFV